MMGAEMMFVVLVAAVVAAMTPSTIGVLILLATVVLGSGRSHSRMVGVGLSFIFSLFLTSLLIGIGSLYLFSLVPLIPANYIAIGIGILIVNAGLLEIKDYFWYGQGLGLRMHKRAQRRIRLLTKGNVGVSRAFVLGAYTAFAALPCIGAPYVAVLALLHTGFDPTRVGLLALYTGIFVAPLVVLLLMVAGGVKLSDVAHWKEDGKGRMRLGVGLLLITLGWIVMLIANGVLNLG